MSGGPRLGVPLAFLTAVRLVFNTAVRFVYPFLPAISRGLGVSLGQAGLLISARWLSGLATPAVVRSIGDRHRRLIVAGLVLLSTGAAITAATSVFVGALAGFVLMGVAKPVYDVAAQAYLSDRTAYERRARYLAVLELTWGGALLVGAPAAGWLIDRFGWQAPFWAIAALALLSLTAVGWVLEPDHARSKDSNSALQLHRAGWTLLIVFALFTFAAEMVFVVFGAWLEDEFGLSLVGLGAASVVIGLSEITGEGATLAVTDRLGKRRAVAIGLVVSGAGFGLLAAGEGSYGLGMALVAVALAGFEFTIVSAIPLASEMYPAARARYLALVIFSSGLTRALGAAMAPFVFERAGMAGNGLTAAAANGLALLLLLRWVREHPGGADRT